METLLFALKIVVPLMFFGIWQRQARNEGIEEGWYYSLKSFYRSSQNKDFNTDDEHAFWTEQRFWIGTGLVAASIIPHLISGTWCQAIFAAIYISAAYISVFSFWHNGKLYAEIFKKTGSYRYKDGFAASIDGPASIDFTWKQRLFLFIFGYLLMIIYVVVSILQHYGHEPVVVNWIIFAILLILTFVGVYKIRRKK